MNSSEFHIVVPARAASQRFPDKMLHPIAGKPLVAWTLQNALGTRAKTVTLATDDERIAAVGKEHGVQVNMTSPDCANGTERIAESLQSQRLSADDIVVNLQGDEPLLPAALLELVVELLVDKSTDIATLSTPIRTGSELADSNVVKVVRDHNDCALYFSRAPIAWQRGAFEQQDSAGWQPAGHLRHLGLYAYRAHAIATLASLPAAPSETSESLEQLRALHYGMKIAVGVIEKELPPGVDVPADVAQIERLLTE